MIVVFDSNVRRGAGDRERARQRAADPDDEIVIAAAVEAQAEFIISEDRHLLQLVEYEGIRIVTRDEFTAELDRLGVP